MTFFDELKRRKVIRVATAYVLGAWVLLQVGDVISEPLGFPGWYQTTLIFGLAGMFPVVVILVWIYELTSRGLIRDRGPIVAATTRYDDPDRRRLAILPLEIIGGSEEDEFLGDGISEEILNAIAPNEELGVIARTSSFRFRGVDVDMAGIRAELGATHVLTGSVRRAGDRLRIAVQLVDVDDESQIWSESFQRSVDDIFEVQADIARSVGRALIGAIGLKSMQRVRKWDLAPAAYEQYFMGRAAFWRGDFPQALEHADESARLDPDNPLVPTLVAEVYLYWPRYGFVATRDELNKANEAATKALMIDPDFSPARAARGMLSLYMERDFASAFEATARAALEQPMTAEWLPILLTYADRYKDAVELQRRIAQHDPLNTPNLLTWANRLNWLGKQDEAIAICRRAAQLDQTHLILSNNKFRWTLRAGKFKAARELLREWGLDPENPTKTPSRDWLPQSIALWLGARLYGEMGQKDVALELAREMEKTPDFTPTTLTEAYIHAGAIDEAYRVYDLGITRFDPGSYDLARPQDMREPEDEVWLEFRDDPRFDEYLKRLGIDAESLHNIDFSMAERVLR